MFDVNRNIDFVDINSEEYSKEKYKYFKKLVDINILVIKSSNIDNGIYLVTHLETNSKFRKHLDKLNVRYKYVNKKTNMTHIYLFRLDKPINFNKKSKYYCLYRTIISIILKKFINNVYFPIIVEHIETNDLIEIKNSKGNIKIIGLKIRQSEFLKYVKCYDNFEIMTEKSIFYHGLKNESSIIQQFLKTKITKYIENTFDFPDIHKTTIKCNYTNHLHENVYFSAFFKIKS